MENSGRIIDSGIKGGITNLASGKFNIFYEIKVTFDSTSATKRLVKEELIGLAVKDAQ